MMNEALPSTEFSNHPLCGHVPWRCEKLSKRGRNATVSSGVNALSIKDVQNPKCRSAKSRLLRRVKLTFARFPAGLKPGALLIGLSNGRQCWPVQQVFKAVS